MPLIKNVTPYMGKLKLTITRDPEWINAYSVLNKIHFDFGFFKVASRMYPNRVDKKWQPREECIAMINRYTGGKVMNYNTGSEDNVIMADMILENSFLGPNGIYMGDLRDGWWFYENNWHVTERKPHGVALVLLESYSDIELENGINAINYPEDIFNFKFLKCNYIRGFVGFSHRAACEFTIGDQLFDETWNITPSHPQYKKYLEMSLRLTERGDGETYEITESMPYKERGFRTIRTWEDAEQSAINFSNYVG